MQDVHGNGHGLMGLLRDGTVGHGACLKTGHDGIHALHFLKRNAFFRIFEIHQAAQISHAVFRVYHGGVLLEQLIIAPSGRLLQGVDGGGIVQMIISAASHFMVSGTVQSQVRLQSQRVKGHGVKVVHLFFNIRKGNAADPADRAGEIPVDYILIQTDGLKNLGALIGLNGGNSHLGSDFYNSI